MMSHSIKSLSLLMIGTSLLLPLRLHAQTAAMGDPLNADRERAYTKSPALIMEDPWKALLWFVNNAALRGIALEEGQIVLAGPAGILNHSEAEDLAA